MAIHEKYFPGTTVSRYLSPDERSWDEGVYQSGKAVLDAELNLTQEIGRTLKSLLLDRTVPSGWVRGPIPFNALADYSFPEPADLDFVADAFYMRGRTALVAGMPLVIEYTETETANLNLIQLEAAPVYGGAAPDVKRTDFVFLEVFRALVAPSPRATATVTVTDNTLLAAGNTITINGSVLTATAGAPGANQFQIGGSAVATAGNIRDALNDVANAFDNICSAVLDVTTVEQVNLTVVDAFAGAAGNAVTLAKVGAGLSISGATFAGGADRSNKPTQSTIYRRGNVQAPSGVNLEDDLRDPAVGAETAQRVQIQYRIRVTGQAEAVNFKTENGFDNASVLAQGTQGSPVASYPFVPADGTTVSSSSSAVAYGTVDSGLWIAGDGSEAAATALGTVDGYVYALPIAFFFRRNNAYDGGTGDGFDPLNNTNGALPTTQPGFANPIVGAIPAGESDRPDGKFCDALTSTDFIDLRRQVVPGGLDLQSELTRQMASLMDGRNQCWAIDAADKQTLGSGSGDVSPKFLVCNEIGRSSAAGGINPGSGDTTRGNSIANFDHIRRRFAAQPVVERLCLPISPADTNITQPGKYVTHANPAHVKWSEGDTITIDFDSLNATGLGDWDDASATVGGGVVSNYWPPGTKITNILRVIHDDGNLSAPLLDKNTVIEKVYGLGTSLIEIVLGPNNQLGSAGAIGVPYFMVPETGELDEGSAQRIFIELEVTYPAGSGATDTVQELLVPNSTVYPSGPVLEDDVSQRPADFERLPAPVLRAQRREIALEYVAGDGVGAAIIETVVANDPLSVTLPRRFNGALGAIPVVVDLGDSLPRTIDTTTTYYGSSSRTIFIDGAGPNGPFVGIQPLIQVTYYAQDPIPNYGAGGYQLAVYYRTNAPQTLGSQAGAPSLPDPLTVAPLAMSHSLWTGSVSVGSIDQAYPYPNFSDQIAVNADVGTGDFGGEWFLTATADLSVGDFNANTGLLNLHQIVQVDPGASYTFSDIDKDVEFRTAYKVADTSSYRPTAMTQPLSGIGTHKVFLPFLARASEDTFLFRTGEVLLVVLSRYAVLDADNSVRFTDSGNTTCAAIYRTQGLLLLAGE